MGIGERNLTPPAWLIARKRDGGELSPEEVEFMVQGFLRGQVPDYQMSAFLMAVYFRGLTPRETVALTRAYLESGERLDLSSLPGVKVDKHSTGGVGDKTSLVLVPLLAAAGLKIAKLSGRGLGHTGGTIDKLESIPGVRTELSPQEIVSQVKEIGVCLAAPSPRICPADAATYALRDVTATVESLPLIAASIVSKKLAGGTDVFVFDVKYGSGAFMKSREEAEALGRSLVFLAGEFGKKAGFILSPMDQPLGFAVGNALEVEEAVEALRGRGPEDLRELCLELGSLALRLARGEGREEARRRLASLLDRGEALERFRRMVECQGGDGRVVEDPSLLPRARFREAIPSPLTGVVERLDALAVGRAALLLGAGRRRKGERVDPAAGVRLTRKVGQEVEREEPLAYLYASDPSLIPPAREAFLSGVIIGG